MFSFLNRATSANHKRFAELKENGMRRYLADHGAIDLASIMVGVIVIGIIGGIIAAAVFTVIPWSQDKAASSNLDAVKTAESVNFAKSSDTGNGSYADGAGLVTAGLLKANNSVAIETLGAAKGDFLALSLSTATGHAYLLQGSTGAVTPFTDKSNISATLTEVNATNVGTTGSPINPNFTYTANTLAGANQ